jgi:glycogen operon protein
MLLGGDEMGRTQRGNNNAYCQDTEISWFDWNLTPERDLLLQFTALVLEIRRTHPIFRRRRWFHGRQLHGSEVTDIGWHRPDGNPMSEEDWDKAFAKSIAVHLNGEAIAPTDARGERVVDDSFLLLFNAHHEPLDFQLPAAAADGPWEVVLDTSVPVVVDGQVVKRGEPVSVEARSVKVLQRGS